MKSIFAVTLLSSTFTLAAFDANWGFEPNSEIPAADLASNAVSWTGPSATAKSGKKYTSGGEIAWKLTQEGGDEQDLVTFTTTHATVDGTAGIGADVVTLMTCIPSEWPGYPQEMYCIVQVHEYDDYAESNSSFISTYYRSGLDAYTAFPVEQSD